MNNTCTDKPDQDNKKCQTAFSCTSEGVFPDPSDCTSYRYCSAQNVESVLYRCLDGYVFQSSTKMCRRKDLPLFCETLDCSRTSNNWVLFKPNPAYYAFCLNSTGISQVYLFKCPDEENTIYDLSIGNCVYNCQREGNFVDRTNCNGYVICSRRTGVWQALKGQCPKSYWFNNGQCEKEVKACVSEVLPKPPS